MQSNVERLDKNRVSIEITLDTAEVETALDQAYRRVVQKVKIDGFRPGKTPRSVLEAKYGPEILYEDAADILVPESYRQALEKHDLSPIEQPELNIVDPLAQGKPFVYQASVQVMPEVKLGDYLGVKAEKPEIKIGEAEVEARMSALREQYAELVPAEHEELTKDDFAVIDFDGFLEGQPFPGGAAKGYTLELGGGSFVPGFAEGMIGMKGGETREVPVKFPEDYNNDSLRGQDVIFKITLREIKTKELPELNDEFAKSLGKETMADLRASVLEQLQKNAERQTEQEFAGHVVKQVVEAAEIEVPGIVLDRETDRQHEVFARNLSYEGLSIDQYLAELGKTEDELRVDLRVRAEAEVKRDLVLDAIAKRERIEPEAEEIDNRIKELAIMSRAKNQNDFRRQLEKSGRMEAIKEGLAREMTVKFLTDKAEAIPVGKS